MQAGLNQKKIVKNTQGPPMEVKITYRVIDLSEINCTCILGEVKQMSSHIAKKIRTQKSDRGDFFVNGRETSKHLLRGNKYSKHLNKRGLLITVLSQTFFGKYKRTGYNCL